MTNATTIEGIVAGDNGEQVTDAQILQLQREAGEAGDAEQVAICERALRGNQAARTKCHNVIADAAAQE